MIEKLEIANIFQIGKIKGWGWGAAGGFAPRGQFPAWSSTLCYTIQRLISAFTSCLNGYRYFWKKEVNNTTRTDHKKVKLSYIEETLKTTRGPMVM